MHKIRLGVNIDHVATVRNARGGAFPDPLRAALLAESAGADGITAHLREDRRHICDADIEKLMGALQVPLNFEMAATDEMQAIALRHKPHAVCIVPEKREERTTEGGLDVLADKARLQAYIAPLKDAGLRISLFIAAQEAQIMAAYAIGADVIELHTGAFCDYAANGEKQLQTKELTAITKAAQIAAQMGLEVHAGHGLSYDTVPDIAALPQIHELNIGHFLIGESIFTGLEVAIQKMRGIIDTVQG